MAGVTAGAIYGTIVATAVIAGTARHRPPGRVLAQLVGRDAAYARLQGWQWQVALVAGAVNGMLGVVIIVLKTLLH